MSGIRSTSWLLEEYRRHTTQLEELRALLHERLAAARAEWESLTEPADDEHAPEAAASGEPVPLSLGRLRRARTAVSEIEAAIDRLDFGVYGTCLRCGAFIALQRLRRYPHTRHCAVCHDAER
ncbi:TraR/DksA C4-type zinc finger protein [Streptosporangium sp. NPDC051022]|uniref:TraR/DksA family transcriptional regulator n=1 Tax=Streptosporangium sp. NPDC051022 TaxID=3155752 RepID=UPI0034208977